MRTGKQERPVKCAICERQDLLECALIERKRGKIAFYEFSKVLTLETGKNAIKRKCDDFSVKCEKLDIKDLL